MFLYLFPLGGLFKRFKQALKFIHGAQVIGRLMIRTSLYPFKRFKPGLGKA